MKNVIIITINYNNSSDTINCLSSIFLSPFTNYKILLLDNHSSDDSPKRIKQFLKSNTVHSIPSYEEHTYSDVEKIFTSPKNINSKLFFINSSRNLGFSGGNNLGIEFSKQLGEFDYFWFLNNDSIIEKNTLSNLLDFIEKNNDEKIAVSNKIISKEREGESVTEGFGYVNKFTGSSSHLKPSFPFFYQKYLIASSLMVSKNCPNFDEDYFLYYEDVQFSIDLKKYGFNLKYYPESITYHTPGGTTLKLPEIEKIKLRSSIIFFTKNFKGYLPIMILSRIIFYTCSLNFNRLVSFIKLLIQRK